MTPIVVAAGIQQKQFGLITLGQAIGCGLTKDAVWRLVKSERWIRVHPGVFRDRSVKQTTHQSILAAAFGGGELAHVSHRAAAFVLGLLGGSATPEITVPLGRGRQLEGVTVHRSTLTKADSTSFGVIPVTSVPRTLVDLAGLVDGGDLRETVDRAVRVRRVNPTRIKALVGEQRFDRARNIRFLREIVDDRVLHGVPDSRLESDAIELFRDYALPEAVRQWPCVVNGILIHFDLAFPEVPLGIELEGKVPHTDPDTWERDHDRHNAVQLAQVPTLKFTWKQVHERRSYVAFTVADGLGLVPSRWRPARKRARRK
ncbi:MAG: type IV toxin-antitoxin system AbiEi family antitoxin domain-containing protein [Actinomycetota bacterium]